MISHEVETLTFKDSGISLEELKLVDYLGKRVGDLKFEDIGSPDEPDEHKRKLRESVVGQGIQQPVVVLKTDDGYWLVEGHHRITLAYEYDIIEDLGVFLIECDCSLDTSNKDYCDFVSNFLENEFRQAELKGWNW